MMRYLIVTLILFSTGKGYSQIRAFDNSKTVLPWIYNPTADFATDIQAYAGYDGRGNSSFTPQSLVAGVRLPILGTRRPRNRGSAGVAGFQALNTSQNLINTLMVNLSYAQQISLSNTVKFSFGIGAGIYNMSYDHDALVYMDTPDPLLNNGEDLFNLHLNTGFSLVMDDRLFINLAAPYLLKNRETNVKEIIFRAGYAFPISQDYTLITSANVDTYNYDLIYGGDMRLEWRKMVSLMAGADRYKYHGGLLLAFNLFSFGYTYGLNYNSVLQHIESHQISIISSVINNRR